MKKAMEIEKLATATANDPRWLSVVERNKAADGTFYSQSRQRVSTGARRARPENVQFHPTLRMQRRSAFVPANGAQGSSSSGAGLRRKLAGCRDPMPPRHQKRRRSFRLSLGSGTQAHIT
jgi:hypothetical protein